MSETERWYVVKHPEGHCEIKPASEIEAGEGDRPSDAKHNAEQWGPFNSQGEAIARRVGLIRAGKCQPV